VLIEGIIVEVTFCCGNCFCSQLHYRLWPQDIGKRLENCMYNYFCLWQELTIIFVVKAPQLLKCYKSKVSSVTIMHMWRLVSHRLYITKSVAFSVSAQLFGMRKGIQLILQQSSRGFSFHICPVWAPVQGVMSLW